MVLKCLFLPLKICSERIFKKYFYRTLTSKMAAFVACWALRKWRDAAHCAVRIAKVKEPLGKLICAPVIGWKSKKLLGKCTFAGKIYFDVCGMQRHKMEIKYSGKCTVSPRSMNVQREWYPFPLVTAVLNDEP